MDLQQLQAEHLRKYMDMKRHHESSLTRNIITEEKEIMDDVSLTRINEQTRYSSQSLNHVQTSQSVQPNQQSRLGFNLFIKHCVAERNANATVQCFPMGNNLHSKIEALITPLLNSTPNQLAPMLNLFTPHHPSQPKDWHHSFPQDLRRHFIQRLIKEMVPDLDLFKYESMNHLVRQAGNYEGPMYEAANSKEGYYQLFADKIFDLQIKREENKHKNMERKEWAMKWSLEDLKLESILATPAVKSEDSSKKNGNFTMLMLLKKQSILLHHLRRSLMVEFVHKKNSSSLSEEQVKEFQDSKEKLEKQIERVLNKLTQVKKLAYSNLSSTWQKLHLQTKQTPSEIADSIGNCDRIEERRHYVREEVSANRRNNQLKAANLNRGLVMDIEDQGASKNDGTFDLTTLNEALPPVSNYKRLPRMTRTLKLQDIVMNNMKQNRLGRLAALELSSMETITAEENS